MTFSKTAYRLNHTKTRPTRPQATPHHSRSITSGNIACRGRALDDIAAAP